VYNIACGRQTTLLDLVGCLNELLATQIVPTFTPSRPGDVKHSLADIHRARTDLGYTPTTDVPAGLRQTLQWWRQRSGARPKATVAA
jgi:nucleoside-diphosphate-sugar epimerase